MRVAHINMLHFGSTGKIMLGIAEVARRKRDEVWTFSPRYYQRHTRPIFPTIAGHSYFGNGIENMLHLRLAQLSGFHGCFSVIGTRQLVKSLQRISPDIVHLHNLHNWTINLPMLFGYLRRNKVRTIWTLHDCWAFTGKCTYFSMVKCERWKTGCFECPELRAYPQAWVDRSRTMWHLKQKWFTGLTDMTLVTPSKWLADLVKQSFLQEYPVEQITNGIDLNIFRPIKSDFRKKYALESKKILLGVAFGWGKRKGLDVFIDLAKRLDEAYQIVLVGTNADVDAYLPKNVLSIHQTENQQQLAKIYSAADLFLNPTREENYPTVNMESVACGTPVLTFRTGGSPEMLTPETGAVVDCDDIDAMEKEIHRICETKPFSRADCVKAAQAFDMHARFEEYVRLYEERH